MSGRLLLAAWLVTLGGIGAVLAWLATVTVDTPSETTVVAVPALVLPLPPEEPPAPAPPARVEALPATPVPAAPTVAPPLPVDDEPEESGRTPPGPAGEPATVPPETVIAPPAPPAAAPPLDAERPDEPHMEEARPADQQVPEVPASEVLPPAPPPAAPLPAAPLPAAPVAPAAPLPVSPAPAAPSAAPSTADVPPPTGDGPQAEAPPQPPITAAPAEPPAASPPRPAVLSPADVRPPLPPGILPRGVDPALVEQGAFGPMPAIAGDGRKPWQIYARPFQAPPEQPRIAIVIGNLGLGVAATTAAIRDLPGAVTLSFAPYADNLNDWVIKARAQEHEVLLDLPMEPDEYPRWDPGPKALFTTLDTEENLSRLDWIMSRVTGYTGLVNQMGSRFTTSEESLQPVLVSLRDRGLLFVDSRSASDSRATVIASRIGLPRAVNDRFIDREPSRDAILRRLGELERIAREVGAALGVGYAYPVTIDVLRGWVPDAQRRGFAIAPASAVVDRQPDR